MKDDIKKIKMEDDLKKNENGRRPQFFFWKTRMTSSTKWKMTLKKMEDDLKKNRRQPQKKWKTTSKKNGRRPQAQLKKSTLIDCDIIVN